MAIVAAVRGNSGNRSNNEHGSHNNSNHNTNNNSNNGSNGNPTMRALVNYLILEADLAEERAKRLRQQADAMARRFGFTTSTSSTRTIVAEAYGMWRLVMSVCMWWCGWGQVYRHDYASFPCAKNLILRIKGRKWSVWRHTLGRSLSFRLIWLSHGNFCLVSNSYRSFCFLFCEKR